MLAKAPRPDSVGAHAHHGLAVAVAAAALLLGTVPWRALPAQQPVGPGRPHADTAVAPDTIPRDTVRLPVPPARRLPRDTLRGDTAAQARVGADTLPLDTAQSADTLGPVPVLPAFPDAVPPGWVGAVWEWDRDALLREGGLTLGTLLRDIPGLVLLRGGHVGMPEAVSALGLGAGRVRVFLDGFELDPLEGQTLDLSRVTLAGLERLRVERRPGMLRIELRTLAPSDHRPYSLVDAATGDLETNYFRGVFAHPRALGGSLALGVERLDTEGTAREQPASELTTWLKYGLLQGQRGGVMLEWRRNRGGRDTLFAPPTVTRSDLVVRARGELAAGLMLDAFIGRSSASGEGGDTGTPVGLSGRQAGARLALDHGLLWGRAAFRLRDARGLPTTALELEAGTRLAGVLRVDGAVEWEDWGSEDAAARRAGIAAGPFLGLSVFGQIESGRRGIPLVGTADTTPELSPRFTDRTAMRAGIEFRHGGLALGAAALSLDMDSIRPLGFGPDATGVTTPGGKRSGFEAYARLPLWPQGMRLDAAWQEWNDAAPWPYLPQRVWSGALVYHNAFLPSRNLELLASVAGRGRPAMLLPLVDPQHPERLLEAPPFENWSMYLQIRVVTVRIFVVWENFTNRLDQRDFARRGFPGQHALYGVRWAMWN